MKLRRLSLGLLAASLLALVLLLASAWFWSGHSSSLATSLAQLARYLPTDQTLEVRDVQGSLRSGGRIGFLRWQRGQLSVQAQDLRLGWTLRPLLDGELRLDQVTAQRLRIENGADASAPTPPTDLLLPLRVDARFTVDQLEWAGPPALLVTGLSGHYAFDGKEHRLDADRLQLAAGHYAVQARLQGGAPLALSAQLQGSVQTRLPASQHPLQVRAQASVQGNLAGPDAALALQASLRPELPAAPAQALQASVDARLRPWQAQPLAQVQANWSGLDLAALWPQAPQTLLAGQAQVMPDGSGWRASVQATNARSGPWNQKRLPLQQFSASGGYRDARWAIDALQARGAGGSLQAQGQWTSGTAGPAWRLSATAQGINPAQLDSRLAATALDGSFSLQPSAGGIAFEARLQTAAHTPSSAAPIGLQFKRLQAQGLWQAPLLSLHKLNVQSDDAQLEGNLVWHSDTQAAQGRLALSLPGASALLQGQLSSAQGLGDISAQLDNAAAAARWLGRWPGAPAALKQVTVQGVATLSGHWSGGWQHQGQELQLQASVRAPRLELAATPPAAPWQLRALQADLTGSLHALRLSLGGQAQNDGRQFSLQAQASGGQREGLWQARIESAEISAQDALQAGPWSLRLSPGLSLEWQQNNSAPSLALSAGNASLSGPVPGQASVAWQAVQWTQALTGPAQWHSQGSVSGLPLAWLELLGRTQLANLGLHGDLLFGGAWDASGGAAPRLRASLQRSSGDLQLQNEDGNATLVAGVREASLHISAEGEQLSASLRWDSERAGQAQADFSSRLQHSETGWSWPAAAPLAGSLQAQLPPVGAWSLLAPPGWRLRGTLDAQATLSGSRAAPLWRGTLQARSLALRSVADGLDFSNGSLRVALQGDHLDIVECQLQGGGGSGGGRLTITGAADWLDIGTPGAALSRLRMQFDIQAQALRVSARADRRLVLSGRLSSQLSAARLSVRGTLKADQALFILAEDTAPQLGEDVLLRRPTPAGAAPTTRAPVAPRLSADIAVNLDLGPDFQVRGRGLSTRLAGNLDLRSTPERPWLPSLSGELRAVSGTYKAYGQQLDIEEGVLRFAGAYDNPALNILALRPNLQQRVGVQILGTAQTPVVRLYAEPDLPDAEKLSWLVMGRAAANGGAEAAVLQQAAMALLGGNGRGLTGGMAQALGLDELSMRGASTDGTTTTGASVTLGKRVARNFYVAYERSLAGTLGTFYIFYDLSRRFTLRAQTGEQSAIDLIFTLRYD